MIPPASSITHDHLLAVLYTESRTRPPGSSFRVLDAGCGEGTLLGFLARAFPLLNPQITIELYGFDVVGPGVQTGDFLARGMERLQSEAPHVDWTSRVTGCEATDAWPYPDQFFDAVVSNQVLEHVCDHAHFFAELSRTLAWGGISAHLFPLVHYVYEGHLHLPFVHRIRNHDLLRAYIGMLSAVGLGKFPRHHRGSGISREAFAELHADYMLHYTNYVTSKQALLLGKQYDLRPSFRYTRELYVRKLVSLWSGERRFVYRRRSALADWLAVTLLRYVSSVTLFLEKKETYRHATVHPGAGEVTTRAERIDPVPITPECTPSM